MSNYSDLSLKELFELAKQTIYNVHANVLTEQYKHIQDEEHQKIKVYTAINRIDMYIATNILDFTAYSYNLENLYNAKKRKSIIKVIEGCKDLTYNSVRDAWYQDGLKELFYKQKEEKKYAEKLSHTCIIVRNNTHKAFVRMEKDTMTLVKDISKASEFIATSDTEEALEYVLEKIPTLSPSDELKAFFNHKMAGRLQAY